MFRKESSEEETKTLVELGVMDPEEAIDQWRWIPEIILKYIYSLPNREGIKVLATNSEITLTYNKGERSTVYHLQADGGAVYSYIENQYYGEDDDKDPYGADDNNGIHNSLALKIRRFMEHPNEYSGHFD